MKLYEVKCDWDDWYMFEGTGYSSILIIKNYAIQASGIVHRSKKNGNTYKIPLDIWNGINTAEKKIYEWQKSKLKNGDISKIYEKRISKCKMKLHLTTN